MTDETRLAIAAGRLFQATRAKTVLQMDEFELRAWAAFTSALGDQHHTGCPVHTIDQINPVTHVDANRVPQQPRKRWPLHRRVR